MAYQIEDTDSEQRIAVLEHDFRSAENHAVVYTRYDNGSEHQTFMAVTEWRTMIALNAGAASRVHLPITRSSILKTMFRTNRGHLGLGTRLMQTGDSVLLLRGLQVPMVARPQIDGSWRLLGPAYVHGCMHGEMWPDTSTPELEVFEFA